MRHPALARAARCCSPSARRSYKLPTGDSSARVAVWREVRRSGALMVQRSVVAFLDHDAFRRAVERFRLVVAEAGGETLALRARPLGEMDATTLTVAWNAARSAEYAELQAECGKFLEEIAHAAPGAEQAGRALARAQEELERYSTAVFEHTHL